MDRTAATNETGSADFDYEVTACHCNALFECDNSTVLTQGSDMFLCVETTADNVKIADVRELTMTQGEGEEAVVENPISNGLEDPLTETTITGKKAVIQYQVISEFFEDEDPLDIVATGTVLLEFTNDAADAAGSTRLLRSSEIHFMQPPGARGLLTPDLLQGWEPVSIQVESAETTESSAVRAVVGVVGGVAMAVLAIFM